MKTLTKEEILEAAKEKYNIGTAFQITKPLVLEAMQSYSDQENARLTAINEKQEELIKRFLKSNLQIPIRDYSLYQKLNDELFSLQAGEEKEENTIPLSGKTICAQCGEIGGNEASHTCHKTFEPKSIFTRRRERNAKTYDFVVKHKVLIYNVTHHYGNFTAGKNDSQLQELIILARKEIGYSDKTWSGDIFNVLVNLYQKICV